MLRPTEHALRRILEPTFAEGQRLYRGHLERDRENISHPAD